MASMSGERDPALRLVYDAGSLDRWTIEAPIIAAIAAVGNITGAAAADILVLNRRSGAISIAAAPEVHAGLVRRRVLDAITAHHQGLSGDFAAVGTSLWLDGHDGRATLVSRIADQPSRTFFLVLVVPDQPGKRERASAHLPDLATLIRLYVTAGTQLDIVREGRDAAVQALDQGECGVIAVRADQSIVLVNAAARALLADEEGLHVRRGIVRPTNYADAIRFREALDRVIDPPRGEARTRRRAIVMLLTREDGARPPVVVIAPASGAREAAGAAATITVLRPDGGTARGLNTLCQLHGLSKVEARLISHLMAGLTVTEAAGEMHVKTDTARAYLKQIFSKTGAHRQADLLSLLARYARALRGDFDFLSV